jgi:hypothetical protein
MQLQEYRHWFNLPVAMNPVEMKISTAAQFGWGAPFIGSVGGSICAMTVANAHDNTRKGITHETLQSL